jgi:hypothetical protein
MMARPADYPIVFLDVDGTLIPFRARPAESIPVAARALVPVDDASEIRCWIGSTRRTGAGCWPWDAN